jgi:hypothetical protein
MIVDIEGTRLPGRACPGYENIHVGLGLQREPFDLVPGDAASAHWRVEVGVRDEAGRLDFRGKFVHGPRGDRFLYLNWGTVGPDRTFTLFRRAKLILSAIPREVVAGALEHGCGLVATVNLTDAKGWPLCARVQPPAIAWRVENT